MNNIEVLEVFSKLRFVNKSVNLINATNDSFAVKILFGAAKSLFIASLLYKNNTNKHYILLVPNYEVATEYLDDLNVLNIPVFNFNSKRHHRKINSGNDTFIADIIDNISQFIKAEYAIAITTPDIFNIYIPKPDTIQHHLCKVKKGQVLNIQQWTTQLALNGYQREQYVATAGEFAVRGGIIDVYPPNANNPFRIELWDDNVDSIRYFDALSQRSKGELDEIEFIDSMFVQEEINENVSIFEHIADDTIIITDTPESIDFSQDYIKPISNYRQIRLNPFGQTEVQVNCVPQPNMHSSVQNFFNTIKENNQLGINTFIAADNDFHLNRLKDLLYDIIEDDSQSKWNNQDIGSIWLNQSLSSGFFMLEEKLAYFVENEIFSRKRNSKSNDKTNKAKGITLKELKQLNIGDFMVHEDNGIGRFDGFQTLEIGGHKQACLRMLYADNDVLYVSLNYLHKVQKYSAAEGISPVISRLGSTEWLRKKARTKKRLKDIARELITLYATRKSAKGFAFPVDTTWQKEFEASFIYEDTIDQARTTLEVKRDMEDEAPMDRLVCGDVSFGKTEIAIRAAFKAATAGKQTAILVPTTILAQQHYNSFTERFANYPISVNMLSRFKNRTEQKEILEELKQNKIDVIIGTHRMLSKDIEFANLGLLIIDEEHRFGVSAKEKLRQIKANIDTLTLTATPIPRTLNFSLLGARDLSQIQTPPRNRLPVNTEIEEWDIDQVVKHILFEIKRSGQVFLVNDKIQGLDKIYSDLQYELPTLRIATIHGQMSAKEVEDTMQRFTDKRIDLLLATKIIESGIDIPNANTMIISHSQNFGLAELYQLRGRVGRTNIQAYCYLTVPELKRLNSRSLQRLLAIEEFTDLGSGLQLSMRDMEIRGAGNILGAEQSGYISDIGFDLYNKVLDEAVRELKISEFGELFPKQDDDIIDWNNDDIIIEINNDAYLPNDYIQDDTERFSYYKALYELTNNKNLNEIMAELADRYGKLPNEAYNLMLIIRLRIAALNTGFTKIVIKDNELIIDFPPAEFTEYYAKCLPIVLDVIADFNELKLIQTNEKLQLKKKFKEHFKNQIDETITLLHRIKKMLNE